MAMNENSVGGVPEELYEKTGMQKKVIYAMLTACEDVVRHAQQVPVCAGTALLSCNLLIFLSRTSSTSSTPLIPCTDKSLREAWLS